MQGPVAGQAIPKAIQAQLSAASAVQLCESVNTAHGSVGAPVPVPPVPVPVPVLPVPVLPVPVLPGLVVPLPGDDVPPEEDGGTLVVGTLVALPEPVAPTGTGPEPHAQEQAGQVWPAAQTGQAQAHVPPPVPPPDEQPPPPPLPPLPPQLQLHGGQVSPGMQAGQAQVQVPPPVLPEPASAGGAGGQSQAIAGHAAFGGQATGCAQTQPPPVAPAA